jgi:hypothetical protein
MKKCILVGAIGAMTFIVNAGDWTKDRQAQLAIEERLNPDDAINTGYMSDILHGRVSLSVSF